MLMLRLSLAAGTSPLWGAVPRWEAVVGGLFRDVSKRVLCSLKYVQYGPAGGHLDPVGSPRMANRFSSALLPIRAVTGCSPWPAPGGGVCAAQPPLGAELNPVCQPGVNASSEWDWAGAGPCRVGAHRAARREAPGWVMGPTQVDSDAGAEGASGFRGKGRPGERVLPGDRVCDQWAPLPGACCPMDPAAGAGLEGRPLGGGTATDGVWGGARGFPGGGLRPWRRAPNHGAPWRRRPSAVSGGGVGRAPQCLAADVDGAAGDLPRTPLHSTPLHSTSAPALALGKCQSKRRVAGYG